MDMSAMMNDVKIDDGEMMPEEGINDEYLGDESQNS